MAKIDVLVEMKQQQPEAFQLHASSLESAAQAARESEKMLADLAGYGLEVTGEFAPIPMFGEPKELEIKGFLEFRSRSANADVLADSMVIPCQVEQSKIEELRSRADVVVWPNSRLTLFEDEAEIPHAHILGEAWEPDELFDLAGSSSGLDCRPFRPGVSLTTVRRLLGVSKFWSEGYRGQNVVVGILDEGVNGAVYPVVGGFSRPDSSRQPGSASITSHGSMCAAGVLLAAPAAKIYDYPFLGVANSGGMLTMFQAVLNQRRMDGTPHLTSNSYGFVGRPSKGIWPNHEVWDINHPVHRKVREVVASGAPAFFAAGNCGENCPSSVCHYSGIGPGKSIHASNSLEEVITIAAVNSRHERIGYSSQGPGQFFRQKPDLAAYSHFFGNFGPGRPGGTAQAYDNGTSAATPVAAGLGALLLNAFPDLSPGRLKEVLIQSAIDIGKPGWDGHTGHGVVNAAAAYNYQYREVLREMCKDFKG